MSRRFYQNFVPQQFLSGAITSGATTLTAPSFANWPTSFPFFAILDFGLATAEIVSVTNIVGTSATIVRGQGGSVAQAHAAGSTFDFGFTAQDFDEANAHVNASTSVHGVSGSVVGTSDTQTLSNKTFTGTTTLAGATATSLTVSGTTTAAAVNASSATVSGAVNAASVTATGAINAATVTTSGNASITGSAGVGGSLTVTGGVSVGSLSSTGIGAITGNLRGTQYTNEAAADTAGVVAGSIVQLSAPTDGGSQPGLYVKQGTNNYSPLGFDTGWTVATLQNSWVSSDGGAVFEVPQYRSLDGVVWVKGTVKNGASGTVILTLPAGYRPAKSRKFIVTANGGAAELLLNSAGQVILSALWTGATNAYVSLEISFPAEA